LQRRRVDLNAAEFCLQCLIQKFVQLLIVHFFLPVFWIKVCEGRCKSKTACGSVTTV
jgi:hypothetical protein